MRDDCRTRQKSKVAGRDCSAHTLAALTRVTF